MFKNDGNETGFKYGNVLWISLLNNVNFLSSSLDSCLRIASFNEGASVVDYYKELNVVGLEPMVSRQPGENH